MGTAYAFVTVTQYPKGGNLQRARANFGSQFQETVHSGDSMAADGSTATGNRGGAPHILVEREIDRKKQSGAVKPAGPLLAIYFPHEGPIS